MTVRNRKLHAIIQKHLPHLRELRHRLHQVPEPGLEERKTSALIATELRELDVEVTTGIAGTGIVADLNGAESGPYVILRADMDGLPVEEASHLPHHSRNPGYSHCCGHDGHATCLVGAARALCEMHDDLQGRVRFLFQPAEEINCGAMEMIEAGVLSDRLPDAMFTLHTWPELPVGHVASLPGTITAGSDSFLVRIRGRGGHGARPHLTDNPLITMSSLIRKLADLTGPNRVVSPCVAHSGKKLNVIPEIGQISGTIRSLNEGIRDETLTAIEQTVQEVAEEHGTECTVDFESGCPPVRVDPDLYELFTRVGRQVLGEEQVQCLDGPSMGSEDFGYYLNHVPGLLFRLGMGLSSEQLHNPGFDFNDDALESGITMLTGLARAFCNPKNYNQQPSTNNQ